MYELKRRKKRSLNNPLFNPYINGISSYDLAYLSSKSVVKSKISILKKDASMDYFAA